MQDFGVAVVWGEVEGLGLLDSPEELAAAGVVISCEYGLRVRTDEFGAITEGAEITVDGDAYTVRTPRKIEDGKFMVLELSKADG